MPLWVLVTMVLDGEGFVVNLAVGARQYPTVLLGTHFLPDNDLLRRENLGDPTSNWEGIEPQYNKV